VKTTFIADNPTNSEAIEWMGSLGFIGEYEKCIQ